MSAVTAARRTLLLGTRASTLASTQSQQVAVALEAAVPGLRVQLAPVTTQGDTDPRSLAQIGGTGVFAAALRTAVLAGQVDLAVHSLKDLPVAQPAGLVVAAVPSRADPRDALVARDSHTLATLPAGARVGTGSPRRASQLQALRPELHVVDVRGNVDTRLAMVASGRLDAVVLAVAGLSRLGRLGEATEVFDADALLPAPGQGALAVECRGEDTDLVALLVDGLEDVTTRLEVTAERAVLAGLAAGCSTPVGALARRTAERLVLTATVGGALRVRDDGQHDTHDTHGTAGAEALGRDVAAQLLARGARAYLDSSDGSGTAMGTH